MRLPGEIAEHMRAHARWAKPEEACGLLAVSSDAIVFFYACTNEDRSSVTFTVDPTEHFRAMQHAESNGWRIGGSFHSHPNGALSPSSADVAAALDPGWIYAIGSDTGVRAFRIAAGSFEEVALSH